MDLIIIGTVEIKIKNRIPGKSLGIILGKLRDGQSLKKLPLSLKKSLESRQKQTLPKPARAAQKIGRRTFQQFVNICCLVHIYTVLPPQFLKILHPDRQSANI